MSKTKFQPISIWDYSTGQFNYSLELTHEPLNTEEDAVKKANYEFDKVGIFINTEKLPERVLEFGALLKDGSYIHIPKGKASLKIMSPQAVERLEEPIPIDSEENKQKVVDVLMSMDESYMVTDDDYMDFNLPLDRVENSIRITPENPLFFDSIAYRIEQL